MSLIDRIRGSFESMDRPTRLRWGYGLGAVLVIAAILSAINDSVALLERKRQRREADLVEMMRLKGDYLAAKGLSQRFSNRMASVKGDDSPSKLLDEIGIRGKSTRITPVKGEEKPGFQEEAAEVKIEGLTANEAMNLLYRLDNGNKPVTVRKALLRTRFDDPSRLDLTLTVAVMRPKPEGER
jgi:general secretion pathway protein M